MMSEIMIDEEARADLNKLFEGLVSQVKLVFFTQKNACPSCVQQRELLEEVKALSEKIELKVYDFVLNGDEVAGYRVDKIPATVVVGKSNYGIRFYGLTAGYEFTTLLDAIMMVSSGRSGLSPQLETLVEDIKERVHIQVFTTLTCPYCPDVVRVVHRFAFLNSNIEADMVESSEFPQLVQRYNVYGVPKTVINDSRSFEGALPAEEVLMEVLKAVNPDKYRLADEAIRESKGLRKAKRVEKDHEYEVVIAGGGPAAMSAAIYCVRKGLDVVLIAKRLGGQITYTGSIENYLGLPNVVGSKMTEIFRNHMESFPLAELLGVNIAKIRRADGVFAVTTDDGQEFKTPSIIYCAGKEYLRLGVPGEESLIGRGIGFCATCDAPLYRDKRVAVIGGGNSAFTAACDLLDLASEVHLIHRRSEFRADTSLVQQVLKSSKVVVHTPMVVREFLGKDKLTGVRVESINGSERFDLSVDGAFIGVGLSPNTGSLKDLVELNEWGEVPVDRNQSTKVEGLFAAGDATDVKEKQICIAVGQGALAALTAHRYLVEYKLTKSKIGLKEMWT